MRTNDPKALFRWVSQWSELIDLEIESVLHDDEIWTGRGQPGDGHARRTGR